MLQTFLKYSIIRFNPSSSSTVGCQPNFSLANVISGWRCFGSSSGKDLNTIFEDEPVILMILSANSNTGNSFGFPRFIGPVNSSSVFIILIIPSIKSSIYWKLRVCFPSPYICYIFIIQRLKNKIRNNPSVIRQHSRTIRIKNTDNLHTHIVLTVIIHK